MIVELGLFALVLALLLSLAQTVLGLAGAALGNHRWMAAVRPAVAGQWTFVAMAFAVLAWAFYKNDFSVAYVANNSNSALPTFYRFSAVWGAHEGSLLLWSLALASWSIGVAAFSRNLPATFAARMLGVLGVVSVGFQAFILFTSNPFERMIPAAMDGRDLNPLLQDFALAVHPPMLYLGYVGFSVAFAFAVAALLEGKLDEKWARWARPWTTVAWMLLTVGIALGSWWAYYELGWGGWWFWDPVENASFMPWLVGTALIHSLAVTEKRGLFKSWTLLLSIIAFSLSLLGTFLVRSGVLVSVHAFASDPSRGLFILIFLTVCVGGSLALYAWRGPALRTSGGFDTVSRESFLLFNNLLLLVAAALILVGTLYPLFLDALNMGKISVGPPYFNMVFLIPTLPLLALLGVGMHAAWKKGRLGEKKSALLVILGNRGRARRDHPPRGLWRVSPDERRGSHGRLLGHPVIAVRTRQTTAGPAGADARPGRHDGGACRRGPVCDRRCGHAELSHRERRRAAPGRQHRAEGLHLPFQQHPPSGRAELPGRASRSHDHAWRRTRRDVASAEARVPRAAQPDDGSRYRGRLEPRPVRRHGRTTSATAPGACVCNTSRWFASSGWVRW